jgi:hypothetical protein
MLGECRFPVGEVKLKWGLTLLRVDFRNVADDAGKYLPQIVRQASEWVHSYCTCAEIKQPDLVLCILPRDSHLCARGFV